ncbi:hypothetical protein [Tenacibaculum aiptasiae]|uniref:hypothetical protein n=1 Tax=Tenacibaculum aiptasiae TaxID=426481 RepID=UPI003B5B18B8
MMKNSNPKTKICYINKSANKDLPKVFVFAQNATPNFNYIEEGIAWKVIKNIGRGSRSTFYYSNEYAVQASWENDTNSTALVAAQTGCKYQIVKDTTGIILKLNGDASDAKTIEIENNIETTNGITAQFCNNGNTLLQKKQVGYNQIAIFKPSRTIYFGLASEVTEGNGLQSAVINSSKFFELDLTGLSNVIVSLNGNPKSGYYFQLENGN